MSAEGAPVSDVVYVVLADIGDYRQGNVISGVFTSKAEADAYIGGYANTDRYEIEAWTVGPDSKEIYPLNS